MLACAIMIRWHDKDFTIGTDNVISRALGGLVDLRLMIGRLISHYYYVSD